MKIESLLIALVAFSVNLPAPVFGAEVFTGRVVAVLDGDTLDVLQAGNAVYELLSLGVCVALHCNYPRADRYGAPLLATDDSYAEGAVSTYGFKVAAEGFEVSSEDSGDDTPATFWLKIAMPAGWEPR